MKLLLNNILQEKTIENLPNNINKINGKAKQQKQIGSAHQVADNTGKVKGCDAKVFSALLYLYATKDRFRHDIMVSVTKIIKFLLFAPSSFAFCSFEVFVELIHTFIYSPSI